jgi:phosphonate transport system substrate-binding protein
MERLESLAQIIDMIVDETGLVIEPLAATDHSSLIDALCSDPPMVHMASMTALPYLIANDLGCAEVALVGAAFGSISYNGQFIARAGSEIQDLGDIAGSSFCRPFESSISGWIVPSLELMAAGVDPNTLEIIDTGSHENTVVAVYQGGCDVGATFVGARLTVQDLLPDVMDAIEVLALTVDIPNEGVQYSPALPAELRDQISDVLLSIAQTEAGAQALYDTFYWRNLAERDHSFYQPLIDLIDAAGSSPLDIFD